MWRLCRVVQRPWSPREWLVHRIRITISMHKQKQKSYHRRAANISIPDVFTVCLCARARSLSLLLALCCIEIQHLERSAQHGQIEVLVRQLNYAGHHSFYLWSPYLFFSSVWRNSYGIHMHKFILNSLWKLVQVLALLKTKQDALQQQRTKVEQLQIKILLIESEFGVRISVHARHSEWAWFARIFRKFIVEKKPSF